MKKILSLLFTFTVIQLYSQNRVSEMGDIIRLVVGKDTSHPQLYYNPYLHELAVKRSWGR